MNPLISRRQFTKQISAYAAMATVGAPGLAAAGNHPPVVDSHLHCFAGKNDLRFPYHSAGPYQPEAPATPEHLLKCMSDGGVDYAVVVHPEPYQDDLRYLEHCLRVGGGKLKGVCLLFAYREDTPKRLTELVHRLPNQIVAIRVHAYAPERLPAWNKPEQLRRLWRTAGDLGLAVQLHLEPRYARRLEPFIREFPHVTTIIDHLGRPFQGVPEEHAIIVRWARFNNVVMKLAVIPERHDYPHRDIRPVIRQLTDAFGPERMIYGGGFEGAETNGNSYRSFREHVASYLGHLTEAGRAQIFGGTALRIFGFKTL